MATKKKTENLIKPSTTLPLFYQKPVPLDKKQHAGHSLSDKLDFSFAAKVNAVPINLIELPNIMQTYPISFSAAKPCIPLAILGLEDGQNLFVNDKGEWLENTYIPAYVRRYPFIFAQSDNDSQLTFCVDSAKGILAKNKKRPFFEKDGEPTDMIKSALAFCKSYQVAANDTQAFCNALEKSGILEERHAEIKTREGNIIRLSGFRQITEQSLEKLNDKTILEWHKNQWMRYIYAHMLSTGNWQKLFRMMEEPKPKKTATKKLKDKVKATTKKATTKTKKKKKK